MTEANKDKRKRKALPPIDISGDCPVCYFDFTSYKRRPIECPFCQTKICKTCVMTYLKEDTYEEAHCMECKKPWSHAFVQATCTKVFWKGPFRDHLRRLTMDRQRNLLVESQEWMGHFRLLNDADEKQRELLEKQYELRKEISALGREIGRMEMISNRVKHDFQFNDHPSLNVDRLKRGFLGTSEPDVEDDGEDDGKKAGGHVLKGSECPREDCRGFLNHQGKCEVCEIFVCAKCRQLKKSYIDDSHVCKKEDIDSVAFIKKDSKPCPSCSAPIHRISGCSHMWCTSCKTAFCWNTLKILNSSQAHNPHMIQWLIQNGGHDPRTGRRTGGVDTEVYNSIRSLTFRHKILSFLPQLWQLRQHFGYLIRQLNGPYQGCKKLRDWRVAYLRGKLEEEKWRELVIDYRTKADRVQAKCNLYETFMLAADSLIRCRMKDLNTSEIKKEAHRLRTFFNEEWDAAFCAGLLGTVKREISPKFYWYRLKCTCRGKTHCTTCNQVY